MSNHTSEESWVQQMERIRRDHFASRRAMRVEDDPILRSVPEVRRHARAINEQTAAEQNPWVKRPLAPLGDGLRRAEETADGAPRAEGLPPLHAPVCTRCNDSGFIMRPREPHDPEFGRAVRCTCYDTLMAAQRRTRLRVLYPAHPDHDGLFAATRARLTPAYLERAWWEDATTGQRRPLTAEEQNRAARQIALAVGKTEQFGEWGHGLLSLEGRNGTGKSTLAAKLYIKAWVQGHAPWYIRGGDLIPRAHDYENRDAFVADCAGFDLLIVDEANHVAHDATGRTGQMLFDIVEARRMASTVRDTVLIGNNLQALGPTLLSRLRASDATWIDMMGVPDARPHLNFLAERT